LEQKAPHKTRIRVALPVLLALAAVALGPWTRAAEPPQRVPTPPRATTIPKVLETHGERRVDNYFWMNDRNDPNVVAYLELKNAYAAAVMKPTLGLQAKLCATKTDGNTIVLVTNMASGHSGASGRLEKYRQTAQEYAFMLGLLGRTE
jgi:protease II